MFSKSKINEPGPKQGGADGDAAGTGAASSDTTTSGDSMNKPSPQTGKTKPSPSVLSSDLTIVGNLRTTGDVQVEGTVQGDIRAHLLTVGESANIEGEIVADDVVVTGKVTGRVRGLKVRLTSTARVEGDIIHKTIAIERRPFRRLGAARRGPAGRCGSKAARATFTSGQAGRAAAPRHGAPRFGGPCGETRRRLRPMAAGPDTGGPDAMPTPPPKPGHAPGFCRERDRRFLLIAAILASALGFIDGTIIAIALPAMREGLGATLTQAQWINNGYLLPLSALILLGGALGDRFGVARAFGAGIVVFVASPRFCAPSLPRPRR
jgi:cytoskeletal protein CcmA (bactofilin family)